MSVNTSHHSRFFWRSSAMFGILNSEGEFQEVNNAWENILGLSTPQLLAKRFLDFVHQDEQGLVEHYFGQLDEGINSVSFSTQFRHNDGDYHNVLWEINRGNAVEYAYYVVGMDITMREQPMTADEMIGVLQEGVILQYANGSIGICNPSAERILGLSADQMMGWTLVDPDWRIIHEDGSLFPTESHPAICTLRTGQSYADVVMGIVKPDDSVIWIRIHTHPLWRDDVTIPYAVIISFSDITPFKETEQALRENLSTHKGCVPENNYDLWDWNLSTNEMYFSARWEKMLGFEEHELLRHVDSWHKRIYKADYKRVMEDIQNHLSGFTPVCENTHRLQHKDGNYRLFLSRAIMVRDSNGEPYRMVGTHIDTTEPRRFEDELSKLELKYQRLMEVESDAIFMVDAETMDILDVNKSTTHLYGYSRHQLLKSQKTMLSARPNKKEHIIRKGMKSISTRYHKKKDGTVFPVEVTTTNPFLFKGKPVLMMAVRDISDRHQLETALWENESKYRQLFEVAYNPIVVFDSNTQHIFDVNQATIDLYGYSKNEWLHMKTDEISAEPVKNRGAFGNGNKRQSIPLRWHKKKDGTVFPVEVFSGDSYLFQGRRSLVCAALRDITERKAYDEALRQERDFVQSLIETSPAFFFALNPDGQIRMINQVMLQATEYSHDKVEKSDFMMLFIPEKERPLVSTEFGNLIKSMQPSRAEYHIKSKSGQLLLVEWHSSAVVKANGKLDYFFCVGINVTERKKAEGHLRLFKSIIESSEEAIAIRNAEEQLIYVNRAYEKLFGISFKEAKQKNLFDHYPMESRKIWEEEMMPALANGQSWEGELNVLYNNNSPFPIWQRVDAVRDAKNKIIFSFGLMHDISERKRMWELLRKQWQEYQMIFNTVPAMIWYRDKENRLLRYNQRAEESFKNHEEELEKYTDCQVVIQLGRPHYGIVCTLKETSEDEISNSKEESSTRWLQFDKIPYRNALGHLLGVIVFAIDITEQKKSQSSLQDRFQEQSFRENETFLASVFEVANFGVCVTDDRGRFLQVNQAFAELYGYRQDELLGQAFTILLPPVVHDSAVREYYSILMTQEEEKFFKRREERHRNGQSIEVQIMASRVIFKDRKRMLVSIVSQCVN
ncbi:MAG: PAS domain S-box protein [Thiomargarita sp.]|nr:PAS domain S-box protein [Thiomargarita sp.]